MVGPDLAPEVLISCPLPGSIFRGTVPLVAYAHDPEDGTPELSVVWSSNRAGVLYRGLKGELYGLRPAGRHRITFRATDSAGNSGEESVVTSRPEWALGHRTILITHRCSVEAS